MRDKWMCKVRAREEAVNSWLHYRLLHLSNPHNKDCQPTRDLMKAGWKNQPTCFYYNAMLNTKPRFYRRNDPALTKISLSDSRSCTSSIYTPLFRREAWIIFQPPRLSPKID